MLNSWVPDTEQIHARHTTASAAVCLFLAQEKEIGVMKGYVLELMGCCWVVGSSSPGAVVTNSASSRSSKSERAVMQDAEGCQGSWQWQQARTQQRQQGRRLLQDCRGATGPCMMNAAAPSNCCAESADAGNGSVASDAVCQSCCTTHKQDCRWHRSSSSIRTGSNAFAADIAALQFAQAHALT